MTPFTHLHVHTEFSLLDGMSQIKKLVERARQLDMDALAITDHGVMYGVIDFYQAAKEAGLKPIIGVEAYVALNNRQERIRGVEGGYYHLVLLARNRTGYHNLIKLTTEAHLNGYYYKPRVDKNLLASHSDGLICLSGCVSGEVPRLLQEGNYEGAKQTALWYREVFGPENYFLEIQEHGIPELSAFNPDLVRLSRETGIPLVATNDSHYIQDGDAEADEILLCIGTNDNLANPKHFRLSGKSFYLKSAEEMAHLFPDLPEAIRNTRHIAEMCELELDFSRLLLPEIELPAGETAISFLRRLCEEGLPRRYPVVTDEVRARLEYELDVIEKTGFPMYILIVWDLAREARRREIPFGVRGSAASSIVCYLTGITDIDPLAWELAFERFLNIERKSMPDIDMDFADSRRQEMIDYAVQKYGRDHVAQIITFGTLGARAAIRDVGRVLSYPLSEVDRIAKLVPTLPVGITINKALEQSADFRREYETDEAVRRLVDTARRLEGISRHASTHAAGVVISKDPLVEHVPLQRVSKGGNEALAMTQYPMGVLEKIGLLKMDFLGLANLTILGEALKLLKARGIAIDLQTIPLDDAKTFDLLSRGETTAIFQLEGQGMRRYVQELKPNTIQDLAAMIALYRPGPMASIPQYIRAKHGEIPVTYLHPKLKPILEPTYGVLVYQDQVLFIARAIAGYSLGRADILRRAIGKKKPEEMKREKDHFLQGARQNNVPEEVATQIWDLIEPFAGYGFNKCVTGDTRILDYDTGQSITIADLWQRYQRGQPLGRTLTLNEDYKLGPGTITGIAYNGVKPVYRLTTRTGRSIVATANHPFLKIDGWQNLGALQPGERIAIPRSERLFYADQRKQGFSRPVINTLARDLASSRLDQPELGDGRIACPPQRVIHEPSLVFRELPCLSVAGSADHLANSDVDWDEVMTIEPAGEQETYDLTIAGTHNFVANDLIVHNSHAVCYAYVAYQTAYLKANYPVEYMTAVLESAAGNIEKVATAIAECRRMGISVLPPHVNHSGVSFTIEDQGQAEDGGRILAIRFGLMAIKNVGEGPCREIIAAREQGGPFTSIEDFCQRVGPQVTNKRVLESLIKAGALDQFGRREALLAVLDQLAGITSQAQQMALTGQLSLFGAAPVSARPLLRLPDVPPVPDKDKLAWEKELLGLYFSEHPLQKVMNRLGNKATFCGEVDESLAGQKVIVVGMVASVRRITTKKGDAMAFVQLEDIQGSIEVTVFPKVFSRTEEFWQEDRIVQVQGKVEVRDEKVQIIADDVSGFEVNPAQEDKGTEESNEQQDREQTSVLPHPVGSPPAALQETPAGYEAQPVATQPAVPVEAAATPPTPPVSPPVTPRPAGNGRRERTTNGDRGSNGATPGLKFLHIAIRTTGDEENDTNRLQAVWMTLQRYPGPDHFHIYLMSGQRQVKLRIPAATTGYCPQLEKELAAILGSGQVKVEVING